jgi:hypothetical protein
MKKTLNIFLFACILTFAVSAQRFNWSTSAGYPAINNSYSGVVDLATDPEGNAYVFDSANLAQVCQGTTIEVNGSGYAMFLYKFNPGGELVWARSFGTDAGIVTPLNLVMGSDGFVYALVHTNSNDIFSDEGVFAITGPKNVILKITTDGQLDAVISTGFSCPACLMLEIANDRIYYQSGETTIQAISFTQEVEATLTFEFDPGTAMMNVPILGSTVLSNGDLVFAGLQSGNVIVFEGDTLFQVDNPFLYRNIMYMRVNEDLVPAWATTYGYLHDPETHFIPLSSDAGDQIYSGWEVLNDIEVAGTAIDGDFNAWAGAVFCMDENGAPVWLREIVTSSSMQVINLYSDHVTGKTWLTGISSGETTMGTEAITCGLNGSPLLAAVDNSGSFSSAIALDLLPGGSKGRAIGKAGDGQLYLGGKLNNGNDYTINCINYQGSKGLFVASFYDIPVNPPVPVITNDGNGLLTASPAFDGNVQWYLNGALIDGANELVYQATESGDYTVTFSNDFGCVAESSSTLEDVTVTGVREQEHIALKLYPNPTEGEVFLIAQSQAPYTLTVYDSAGSVKEVYQITQNNTVLDLDHLSAGLYLLEWKGHKSGGTSRLQVH